MPEVTLSERRTRAIGQVAAFLLKECGAVPLLDAEVREISRHNVAAGWRLNVEPFLEPRELIVCVDVGFPFSNPQFLLKNGPPFLTWPHVEPDGKLCLSRDTYPTDASQPAEIMRELLCEAFELLKKLENGSLTEDFRSEFLSYWNRTVPESGPTFYSLLEPRGPSRIVRVGRVGGCFIAAETEGEISRWYGNFSGKKSDEQQSEEACFVWLQRPPLPIEYPNRAQDVWKMGNAVGASSLLSQLVKRDKSIVTVLFGAGSDNGPCFGGLRISEARSKNVLGKSVNRKEAGFRPNYVPEALQARRFFLAPANVSRARVDRADPSWIHGRDHDPSQSKLRASRVAIIGCGAIGAAVGVHLGMAGVGNLLLVDPEALSWANVGRHPLGASSVGLGKAEELARMLASRFPHLEFEYRKMGFVELLAQEPSFLEAYDLVLCATGIWNVESALNNWQLAKGVPKYAIYAWAEPHACAGHAVGIISKDSCFQCQLSLQGNSKLEITGWNKNEEEQEPACGAMFQPFGPIELSWTTALCSTLVLDCLLGRIAQSTHRMWAGPKDLLDAVGGKWNPDWIGAKVERELGGFLEERRWLRDLNCVACR